MTRFRLADTDATLDIAIDELIIAGWAGREQASIQAHIEELQALGVSPPSQTPLFYRVSGDLLTSNSRIQVLGEGSSGEVEALLVGTPDGTFVGVSSDHTDREAEAWSVAYSKQCCAKPAAALLWRLDDVIHHWDELQLESHATIGGERHLYQHGSIAELLHPKDLLASYGINGSSLRPGQAMLCGTLPVHGGVRPASRFDMALIDPVRGRRIDHGYEVQTLPVVS
ncbi:hypothetical protein J2T57_000529 [Natronocella acetinitrilica]|uniref:DUF2848 domain-containing protein n=1 Tax=Natronocella acetinitrilica TaxID=414046 RepID=A0AAE3G3V5_9GAMM|nr:DUF2848 domain-containing protein [Natronocella acetinitrilica]MCP1673437.1 hypothetical protein [Natronocella acetinitrilica]